MHALHANRPIEHAISAYQLVLIALVSLIMILHTLYQTLAKAIAEMIINHNNTDNGNRKQ